MSTTTTNPFFPVLAMKIWGEPGRAQYIGRPRVWATITADNQYTPPTYFAATSQDIGLGDVNLSISGTFAATVTLQRSFDDGATWLDVEQFAAPVEKIFTQIDQSVKWRLGVKPGDFTSGSIECVMAQ